MRKYNAKEGEKKTHEVPEPMVGAFSSFLESVGDPDRARLEREILSHENNIEGYQEALEEHESRIESLREDIGYHENGLQEVRKALDAMPKKPALSTEEVRADLARAMALPFVKSVSLDRGSHIEVITRSHSLTTTLTRKFSRNSRWYSVKPYKIALPAYKIRLGLVPFSTLANERGHLAMALAEYENDTKAFYGGNRYGQRVHAHWATTYGDSTSWSGVCLGEYESEVSRAFRKGLTEGLTALAVFLQMSGAQNGYVHTRHEWALWMGKTEYNAAIVPSLTDKTLTGEPEDEDEEGHDDDDHVFCDTCGECMSCGNCLCDDED